MLRLAIRPEPDAGLEQIQRWRRGSRTSNSKGKDEIRGFFPFASLRVRMTNIFDDSIASAKRLER